MAPTLVDGDLLLVLHGARPRDGDLVVVDLPPDGRGRPRPRSVKRRTGADPADPSRHWVERDNPGEGVDSWTVGSLADEDVQAVVVLVGRRTRTGLLRPLRRWRTPRRTRGAVA